MRRLEDVGAELDQLDGMAQLLSKDCTDEDAEVILQQAAAMRYELGREEGERQT